MSKQIREPRRLRGLGIANKDRQVKRIDDLIMREIQSNVIIQPIRI